MSRIARKPLLIPKGVDVKRQGDLLNIKGPKGSFDFKVDYEILVAIDDGSIMVSAKKDKPLAKVRAMVGTTRVLLENAVIGTSNGFEKKLELKGVGYRAKVQGKTLELNLGYSHPIMYDFPEGVTIEAPSNTEVVVKSIDKQKVGQAAAEIRKFRPLEPYKGKGVRYAGEQITLKDTKKK